MVSSSLRRRIPLSTSHAELLLFAFVAIPLYPNDLVVVGPVPARSETSSLRVRQKPRMQIKAVMLQRTVSRMPTHHHQDTVINQVRMSTLR